MVAVKSLLSTEVTMFAELKKLFQRPSLLEAATKELADAEHARLEAQTAVEYAESVVIYNDKRIARLLKYIAGASREATRNESNVSHI